MEDLKEQEYYRLVSKIKKHGVEMLTQSELSELFLSIAVPYPDYAKLYDRSKIQSDPFYYLEMTRDELESNDISEAVETLFLSFPKLAARINDREDRRLPYASNEAAAQALLIEKIIMQQFCGVQSEQLTLLFFSKDYLYKGFFNMAGGNTGIGFNNKKICAVSLNRCARYLVMAHNHLSGDPSPSENDCISTAKLFRILDSHGIILANHYIVTRDKCVSIKKYYQYFNTDPEYLESVITVIREKEERENGRAGESKNDNRDV